MFCGRMHVPAVPRYPSRVTSPPPPSHYPVQMFRAGLLPYQVTTNLIDIKTLAGKPKPRCPLRLQPVTARPDFWQPLWAWNMHCPHFKVSWKRHLRSTLLSLCSASFYSVQSKIGLITLWSFICLSGGHLSWHAETKALISSLANSEFNMGKWSAAGYYNAAERGNWKLKKRMWC